MDMQAAAAAFNTRSQAQGWAQLCDPALAFEHRDFAAVRALWAEQARGRAMPSRADMSARVLKTFLPSIGLKERVETDPSRYRWRLMGTKVAQTLGERTGKFADEDATPQVAARWTAGCDLVLEVGQPLRFIGRVLANGKDFLFSELLFMPLAGGDGVPRFVMGFSHYGTQQLSHGTARP
jgi:hypothetical protein